MAIKDAAALASEPRVETREIGIGHNGQWDNPEFIEAEINSLYGDDFKRVNELLAKAGEYPEKIETEDDARRITDFGVAVKNAADALEKNRKAYKDRYVKASKAVDGCFRLKDAAEALKDKLRGVMSVWQTEQRRKEELRLAEERRQAAEVARLAQEKADTLAAQAAEQAANGDAAAEVTLAAASNAEVEQAEALASLAKATKAEPVTLARGDYNSSASLRGKWVGRIIDRNQVDLEMLRPYVANDVLQKAINEFIRANKVRLDAGESVELRGVSIARESTTVFK